MMVIDKDNASKNLDRNGCQNPIGWIEGLEGRVWGAIIEGSRGHHPVD